MIHLTRSALHEYLRRRFGEATQLISFGPIGEAVAASDDSVKQYGYGKPILLVATMPDGAARKLVLETMAPGPFGHEHRADRAQAMLWDYDAYALLPCHVSAVDVGALTRNDKLVSLADTTEFFVMTEFVEGESYHLDLARIANEGVLRTGDRERTEALAGYLADIHSVRHDDRELYRRRLRELIGHGECIMGLTDSYPTPYEFVSQDTLRGIEEKANRWRWHLHDRADRLCQVHGDFHPWNVLFRSNDSFSVLDRSRGEWGEAADDVTALSINYLFFSLRRFGRLHGPFEELFQGFWAHYQAQTHDTEILSTVAPFFAFRGLVVAHPIWYPNLDLSVRRTIFRFIENVLDSPRFEPSDVHRYCETG